ncbi:NACHT domain-containing protein [Rhodococcus sp. RS1C4]|nr:NACHT domain-containing protein [Rhodococcus sp. RS1C4]
MGLKRLGFFEDSSKLDQFAARFNDLPRKRLVVLGGPGCGKSTLAVQMLSELLRSRQPSEPIPFLLSVAGWNVDVDVTLGAWLHRRLAGGFPFLRVISPTIVQQLVNEGWILPILDGLDEVDPTYRPRVLRALNNSMSGNDPVIVTCRTSEFVTLVSESDVVTAALVVEAQEIAGDDVAAFMTKCIAPGRQKEWVALLNEVRSPSTFGDVAATPLGLWLLRTVYIEDGPAPEHLLDKSQFPGPQSVKRELFRQLIPSVILTRPPDKLDKLISRPRRLWDPLHCSKWLGFLAVQMGGRHDVRWWNLPVSHWAISAVLGCALAVTAGVSSAIVTLSLWNVGVAVIVAGALAVLAAVAVGTAVGGKYEPHCANLRLQGRTGVLLKNVISWLAPGLLVWLAIYGLMPESLRIVKYFVSLMISAGLVIGISKWIVEPDGGTHSRRPTSTYRESRAIAAMTVLGILVIVGPLVLIGRTGLRERWDYANLSGWALVTFVVALVIMVGSVTLVWVILNELAWGHYLLVSFWLWVTGRSPRNLISFMEDANRLGLLKATGAVYQFRHTELQEYLVQQHSA